MRDDPTRLLRALDHAKDAEVVVLDDGTGDDVLAARVAAAVRGLKTPACFVRLHQNIGRARGRNRLSQEARSGHFLFLDSDMLPDHRHYLDVWSRLITSRNPAVAFGGLAVEESTKPEHAVARALAMVSDCGIAMARAKLPEKHVFTSNLLVRRDVFEAQPFDETFKGWGWEDVEWALRVGQRHRILHVDNPATHLGLETAAAIATKYEQSAANFARMLVSHRDEVKRYPIYRAARFMSRLPRLADWRPWVKAVALAELAPVRLRAFALRLYRATLYAEAVA